MSSPLSQLSNDLIVNTIKYLDSDDLKSLRLSGNKSMCLSDPRLTSHLHLRMDKVPFFCENNLNFSEEYIQQWLYNRSTLVIKNDEKVNWSASRVTYLVSNGFMDSVTDIIIHNCHLHSQVIEMLSRLPSIKSMTLVDQGDHSDAVYALENIITNVGTMSSLTTLDIEFDTVIHGSRLTFLKGLQDLRHLRLIGFDLSEGITHIGILHELETLYLCHGNFYSSPNEDVNEKELTDLIGLRYLKRLHLEGFDCLTGAGLAWTHSLQNLILKHCQETSDGCLTAIERMEHLNSLHFVLGSCDDVDTFDQEDLSRLNSLSELKSLSLFYVLEDYSNLRALPGLTSLKTLNLAFDETMNNEDVEDICRMFPMLQKLRIFAEDCDMEHSYQVGGVEVEFAEFSFGDMLYLD